VTAVSQGIAGRGLDVVFANAAAIDIARIGDVTQEYLQKALPLLNDGGSIILNSSNPKAKGYDGIAVSAAIMAALRSLARTWASELRDRNIRVNVIGPDATETPGLDSLAGTLSIVPLARYATAEEVANAALFLAAGLTDETLREQEPRSVRPKRSNQIFRTKGRVPEWTGTRQAPPVAGRKHPRPIICPAGTGDTSRPGRLRVRGTVPLSTADRRLPSWPM
jgi:hypothetical protein